MIRPLPGYCLIEPIEDEGKTSKGVYLPDSSKDKPSRGRVIAIGGTTDNDRDVKVSIVVGSKLDQIVVYKKYTNQEVTEDGVTYLLVPFSDLLAVYE